MAVQAVLGPAVKFIIQAIIANWLAKRGAQHGGKMLTKALAKKMRGKATGKLVDKLGGATPGAMVRASDVDAMAQSMARKYAPAGKLLGGGFAGALPFAPDFMGSAEGDGPPIDLEAPGPGLPMGGLGQEADLMMLMQMLQAGQPAYSPQEQMQELMTGRRFAG